MPGQALRYRRVKCTLLIQSLTVVRVDTSARTEVNGSFLNKERALARFFRVLLTVSLTSTCDRMACTMISQVSFVVTDADAFRDSVRGGVMQ